MNNTIHQVFKKNGKPFACIVGTRPDNQNIVLTGAALCALGKNDRFDKQFSLNLANQRVFCQHGIPKPRMYKIPYSIGKEYKEFVTRCRKYFQGCDVIELPIAEPGETINKSQKKMQPKMMISHPCSCKGNNYFNLETIVKTETK